MRIPGVLGVRRVVDIRLLQNGSCLRWRSSKEKEQKEKVRFCHIKNAFLDTHGARHNARLLTQSSVVVRRRRVYSVCRGRGRSDVRKVGSERGDAGVDVAFDSNAKRFYVREDVPARRVFTWILSRRRRATTVFVHGIERLARWRRTEKTNLDANRRARTNHFRSVRLPSFGRAAFDEEVRVVQHRFGSQ